MATKKTAKKGHAGEIAVGAGMLAAAAAAGAGYYFYGAKDAPKHRKQAATWADGMKKEVLKQAKTIKKLDKKAMAVIVDRATASYQGVKNIKREDLMRAANELKANWKEVEAELARAAKTGSKGVKKAAKTATSSPRRAAKKALAPKKKVAKKAAKKTAKKSAKKKR